MNHFRLIKHKQANLVKALLALFIILSACDPEREEIDTSPSVRLNFSTDTVFFDTVFTSLGSITKRLTVINPNRKAVNISRIALGNLGNSPFSLIIHGKEQNSLENIRLLGDDSLIVLAKVTIDPLDQDLPFEVKDSIIIETNGNSQDVKLRAWGQDANFIRSEDRLFELPCSGGVDRWTAERPYVIYDSLFVPKGCELIIEAGTQIHFNINSGFLIEGKLTVAGSPEAPIIFQALRSDEPYDEAAGQWDGITFGRPGSGTFNWALIKNATVGVRVGTFFLDEADENLVPKVTLENTEIRNMAVAGIQAFTSEMELVNTLIHNCVDNGVAFVLGGNYTLKHCTIASYQVDFIRNGTSLLATNSLPVSDTEILVAPLSISMQNSIIWGGFREELEFLSEENAPFVLDFHSNILRTELEQGFEVQNLVNQDPDFYDPFNERLYYLGKESAAINAGLDLGITTDLNNAQRDNNPDIGAYEYFEIAEEEGE